MINLQSLMLSLSVVSGTCVLIWYQVKGDPKRSKDWLGFAALSLDILALCTALIWAVNQGEGILKIIFVGGFVALVLAKAVLPGSIISAKEQGKSSAVFLGTFTLFGLYLVIYFAGVFGGAHDSARQTNQAAEESAPYQSIVAQLASANTELAGLSSYAATGKVEEERAVVSGIKAEIAGIQQQVEAKRVELNSCPRDHITVCRRPAQETISSLQSKITELEQKLTSEGSYTVNHERYKSKLAHIAELEKKRAAILSGDSSVNQVHGIDDRLISWITGVDGERAAGIKWMFFVLAFDLLSLGLRIFSELHQQGSTQEKIMVQRFQVLIQTGLPPDQIARLVMEGNRNRMINCKECGTPFEPVNAWQKFCSANCRAQSKKNSKPPIADKESATPKEMDNPEDPFHSLGEVDSSSLPDSPQRI